MSWKEKYRTASFRGVEFFVDSHETTGGRRVSNHEYPLRDDNYAEDMGRKTRSFQISAYVLEPDYFSKRDALIKVLEEGGAAEFIHPYLGRKTVLCDGFRVREQSQIGGKAEFSISFIETGLQVQPVGVVNSAAALQGHRDDLINAARTDYINSAVMIGVPEFVRDGARLSVQDFGQIMDTIQNSGVFTIDSQTQSIINKAATLSNDIKTLQNLDEVSIVDSAAVADQIISTISNAHDLAASGAAKVDVLKQMQELNIHQPEAITVNAVQANANKQAVKNLIDHVALAEHVRAAESIKFNSFEDAINTRDDVLLRIDEKIETASDTTFSILRAMRSEVVRAIPPTDQALPRINTVSFQQNTNSLLASYKAYGTADKESEIVTRNNASHPGFLSANQELEILV